MWFLWLAFLPCDVQNVVARIIPGETNFIIIKCHINIGFNVGRSLNRVNGSIPTPSPNLYGYFVVKGTGLKEYPLYQVASEQWK